MLNRKQPSNVGDQKNIATRTKDAKKDEFLEVMRLTLQRNFLGADEQYQTENGLRTCKLPGVIGAMLENLRELKGFRQSQTAIQDAMEERQAAQTEANRKADKQVLWAPKRAPRPICQHRFDAPFLDLSENSRPTVLSLSDNQYLSSLSSGPTEQMRASASTQSTSSGESDGFLRRGGTGGLFGTFVLDRANPISQSNTEHSEIASTSSSSICSTESIPVSSSRLRAKASNKRRRISAGSNSRMRATKYQSETNTDSDVSSNSDDQAIQMSKRQRS